MAHNRGMTDAAAATRQGPPYDAAVRAAAPRRVRPRADRAGGRRAPSPAHVLAGFARRPLRDARPVAIYRSLPTEPPTEALAEALHARGLRCWCRCCWRDKDLDWCLLLPDGSDRSGARPRAPSPGAAAGRRPRARRRRLRRPARSGRRQLRPGAAPSRPRRPGGGGGRRRRAGARAAAGRGARRAGGRGRHPGPRPAPAAAGRRGPGADRAAEPAGRPARPPSGCRSGPAASRSVSGSAARTAFSVDGQAKVSPSAHASTWSS